MPSKSATKQVSENPTISESVISRSNPDGSVSVVDLNNQQSFFTIKGASTEVWRNLKGQLAVDQIVERVCNTYEVDPSRCKKDVVKFLKQLEKMKLLKAKS